MGLVLESSAPSVALSLSKMGWMVAPTRGGRGERSFDWMSTTASPNSFIHSHRMHDAARPVNFSHPIQLIANYMINAAATAAGYRALYGEASGVRFVTLQSETLFTSSGVLALFDLLGMTPTASTQDVLGKVVEQFKNDKPTFHEQKLMHTQANILRYEDAMRTAIGAELVPPLMSHVA